MRLSFLYSKKHVFHLGADSIQNDGIYTRYFTHYTGKTIIF